MYNLPEPACLYKWQWTTVYLSQQQASTCHRVEAEDISLEDFDFHNTQGAIQARKKMLDGKWPGKGCEYCRDLEEVGGLSDREHINNSMKHINRLTPKEVLIDPLSTHLTPSTLEVYFSNLCNQACLYCFSKYSSKIEAEHRHYNTSNETEEFQLRITSERKKNYKEAKTKFWNWMKSNAISLKEYHILGGEPLYQEEIWENIEFFKNNPCPDLNIQIFTNLNIENKKARDIFISFQKLIDNKNIKNLTLMLSKDCWGPSEEYVRSGSNNIVWKENFDMLSKDFCFSVMIHSTLCNLSIKSNIDLITLYNNSFLSRLDNNCFNYSKAGGHPHLDIGIFPKGFFDKDFDMMIKNVKYEWSKTKLEGFKKFANSRPYRPDLVYKLKNYLDIIDQRRGMNWRQTFPWLDKFNPDDYTE